MMVFNRLTPGFWAAPQLSEADLVVAAAAGVKTIISNRPDGEAGGQPSAAAIAAAASRLGVAFAHLPVLPGKIEGADVLRMADLLASSEAPVLAFCRTGTRSASLWALTRAGLDDPDGILQITAAAGYEISQLRPRLAKRTAPRSPTITNQGGQWSAAACSEPLRRDVQPRASCPIA